MLDETGRFCQCLSTGHIWSYDTGVCHVVSYDIDTVVKVVLTATTITAAGTAITSAITTLVFCLSCLLVQNTAGQGHMKLLSAVGQRCPTVLPFSLTELRKVSTENPVTVQVVVVSKRFLVLTVIREILTLLTILLFEIAKNLWFH